MFYLRADDANNLSVALLKIFPKLIILLSVWGFTPKYLLEKVLTQPLRVCGTLFQFGT